MAETPAGNQKPDAQWGGTWFTIDRSEYDAMIYVVGGIGALTVVESATRPGGQDCEYTAWAVKGHDVPLIASELRGCGQWETRTVFAADCPGTHTFWMFIPYGSPAAPATGTE